MTAMSASKSFIAAFVGVPAQLRRLDALFIMPSVIRDTKVSMDVPFVLSWPEKVKISI